MGPIEPQMALDCAVHGRLGVCGLREYRILGSFWQFGAESGISADPACTPTPVPRWVRSAKNGWNLPKIVYIIILNYSTRSVLRTRQELLIFFQLVMMEIIAEGAPRSR